MSTVQMIEITKIRVLNPRVRNKAKFSEIVTNVSKIGLKKLITVCRRAGSADEFDLACGQGRLEAYLSLGQTDVPALVRDATAHERYLMSLVENIARRPPDSLDLVRGIADLRKRGYSPQEIADHLITWVDHFSRAHPGHFSTAPKWWPWIAAEVELVESCCCAGRDREVDRGGPFSDSTPPSKHEEHTRAPRILLLFPGFCCNCARVWLHRQRRRQQPTAERPLRGRHLQRPRHLRGGERGGPVRV